MGSYTSALGDVVAKVAAKAMDVVATGLEHTVSVEHSLNKYPESKIIAEAYHNDFVPTKNQYVGKTIAQEQLKRGTGREPRIQDPQHQHFGKRLNPITQQPLIDDPIDLHAIDAEGSRIAREKWLGKGDVAGILTAHMLETKYGKAAADSFADNIAFVLKDNKQVNLRAGYKSSAIPVNISTFKRNAIEAGVGIKDTKPTYSPKTDLERAITSFTYATFSPLIAIPHIATFFNGMFGTDATTYLKGTAQSLASGLGKNSDHWRGLVETGAMTESLFREASNFNTFYSSGKKFNFPDDSVIPTLINFMHQPGFRPLRNQTLISGGIVGKMTAEQAAMDFYHNPKDPAARWQLWQFGLEPDEIVRQGGRLSKEQLNTAIFKFVDRHYFIDNTLQRSRLLQSSATGRILGMYHGYVTRQAKLMGRAMFRDWKERGPASVTRNLIIGSTIFPMLGEAVKLIGEGVRGQNAVGDAQKDLEDLTFQNGPEAAAIAYFETLGHAAAFGIYSHMVRGSFTHSLAGSIGGPLVKAGTDLAQDTGSAIKNDINSGGEHIGRDWKAAGRDITYDLPGVSLLAQLLDHRLLPKANENPDNDPLRQLYEYMRDDSQDTHPDDEDPNKDEKEQ